MDKKTTEYKGYIIEKTTQWHIKNKNTGEYLVSATNITEDGAKCLVDECIKKLNQKAKDS